MSKKNMKRLTDLAEMYQEIRGRYDGGYNYTWGNAMNDLSVLVTLLGCYTPKSRGNIVLKRLLLREVEIEYDRVRLLHLSRKEKEDA